MSMNDIIGKMFGRLKVLEYHHKDKKYNKYYKCICSCGNTVIACGYRLKSGETKSCGCLRDYKISLVSKTHGLSSTPIYKIWLTIKQRCFNSNNKNYYRYGGRGITMCNEWLCKDNGFCNFYEWSNKNGYKKGLSIDRIDNDGNYEPSNCRWVDKATQSNNTSSNVYITKDGETKTATQWARYYGYNIKSFTAKYRELKDIDKVLDYFDCRSKGLPYNKEKRITVTFKGETKALSVFCKELGFCYESIVSRIFQRKWSIDKALSTPIKKTLSIEYNGNFLELNTIAKMNNIVPSSLKYQWVRNNYDIYKAVEHFKGEKWKKNLSKA